MKTFLSVSFLLFMVLFCTAQITLTRLSVPMAGDQRYPRSCQDSLPDAGPSGANVTWDFSSLVIDFVSFSPPVNYIQNTGYVNLSYWQQGGMYGYGESYHVDSSTFNLVVVGHESGGPVSSVSQKFFIDDIVRIPFPFTYGDSFLDSFYYDYSSGMFSLTHKYYGFGLDSTIADGWGTLILPQGSFDALRIYHNDQYLDTNNAGGYTSHTEEAYEWYIDGYRGPVLVDRPYNGDHIFTFYEDPLHPIAVGEEMMPSKPVCYALGNGKFVLRFNDGTVHRLTSVISDLSGKKLLETESHTENRLLKYDLSGFKDGIYLLSLLGATERYTFRLVMVR